MSREIRSKLPNTSPNVFKIREGGTEATTSVQALINLNAVPANLVDKPGGVLSIDANKKLKPDAIAGLSITGISVDGPASISINQVQTYTITDFDSFINYTITAIGGSVSRSGSTITYTAPGVTGPSGFIINGKTVTIAIGANIVLAPNITNILSGSTNIGSTISLVGSSFAVSSGTDTQQWADWQIATDLGFTNIVSQSLSDTINKTSWTSGTLSANTTYYARVRYKGNTYSYSNWSSILTFTTKSVFAPTIEQAVITAPDKATDDHFGWSVAIDGTGTRVVIGAPGADVIYLNTGAVYVFSKSGITWSLEQKLSASDKTAGDQFGSYVGISADSTRIVIGAPTVSVSGFTGCGAIYIFVRSGTVWTQEIKLLASNKASSNYFGTSVSINNDGSRLITGSPYAGGNGRAYVFTRSGVAWTEEQIITPVSYYNNALFGYGVCISGDGLRCIVGSYQAAPSGLSASGEATVYIRSGTIWTAEQVLTAGDKIGGEALGRSVSINNDGSRCIAGAFASTGNYIGPGSGAAYVYSRSGSIWIQEAKLVASDETTGDQFGYAVFINSDGTVIAASSYPATVGGILQAGKAYTFTRSGTSWTQVAILSASNKSTFAYFGSSVSLSGSGSILGVGSYNADPSSITNAGSAYIFV